MGPAIMPNLMHEFLYRGQNRDYRSFIPSIYRDIGIDYKLWLFYRELQLLEFELLINRFPRVKMWRQQGFYVWSEAIAQHYGFRTTLLDITNNFDVALFFACCKYDPKFKIYRPLEASDLLSTDEQNGVIYGKGAVSISDLLYKKNIRPIGYQPFMRPNNQCGFVCCLEKNESSLSFDWKILFKHDLKYSKKIYDEFEGGNKIFPKSDSRQLEEGFYSIIDAETYSEEAFLNTVTELKLSNHNATSYRKKLMSSGILIGKAPHNLNRQQIRQIDRGWEFHAFLKQCGVDELTVLPTVKQPK
jgi:hypothetical protein